MEVFFPGWAHFERPEPRSAAGAAVGARLAVPHGTGPTFRQSVLHEHTN